MKNVMTIVFLLLGLIISTPTLSNKSDNKLGVCMIDSLTGKERKQLAKWIYFAIAAHPEIKPYSKATTKNIKDSDEVVGKLITRLLTVDCPTELNEMGKMNHLGLSEAFELVGQVAMQELMNNQLVINSIMNYIKYTDIDMIESIFTKK